MNGKYIIGSGISGLIFKYYNPDYEIIGEQFMGRLASPFFSNILYFHNDYWNVKLLNDLKVPFKIKNIVIKYYLNGSIKTYLTDEERLEIISRKANLEKEKITDIKLSVDDNFISYLEFDTKLLMKKLKPKTLITEKVLKISDKLIYTNNTAYEYSHLISTVPASVFWTLYEDKSFKRCDIKSYGTFFRVYKTCPNVFKEDYDFLYVNEAKLPELTRISKRDSHYLFEFKTKDVVDNEFYKQHFINAPEHEYYQNDAIIHTNLNNIPPPNVDFLGRFAVHEHSYKQQNAIRFSALTSDFKSIFQRQKNFTANFVDFNKLGTDDVYKKEQIFKYVLAMQSQITAFNDAVGYKEHKKGLTNLTKAKKEYIDAFKYFLNIGLCLGIDVFNFIELFNEVSNDVETEYFKNFK